MSHRKARKSRMSICKYCKKPISNGAVWNPDSEGNGYHHACLCEMEFESRDRQIYNKGKADVLKKIRTEIMSKDGLEEALEIIDRYTKDGE
jgi:hypothetical protein